MTKDYLSPSVNSVKFRSPDVEIKKKGFRLK